MTETRPNYSIYPHPEPQSDLEAALAKLREDSSKPVHLERRHVLALREYIAQGADIIAHLQAQIERLKTHKTGGMFHERR